MSDPRNPDYHKYADDQVRTRESEDAIGRLRLALFLAALGPAVLLLAKITELGLPRGFRIGVLATAPLGILLLVVRFIQLPSDDKTRKGPLTILVLTLIAAAATFVLAKKFSMFP